MDAETRKSELKRIKDGRSNIAMTGIPLRYHAEILKENVYKIPLDYLVYNKYNGRIGTAVQSYETQNGLLNPENEVDKKTIEQFLFLSKEDRNKKTMESLQQLGQQQYGIVTADGIIVDGNRRAMLLNKLFNERGNGKFSPKEVEHCQFFLAIILPDDATVKDIQQLETEYQMGGDEKLDYNATEKYLKCKELKKYFDIDRIAEFMSEKPSKIEEWLDILELMEEYLESYGYKGIYTRLEKTEGPFVDLNGYIKSYKTGGANIRNMDWACNDADISDLKTVCFDYIRARYEGKDFRDIGKTGKDGSIFFYQDIWKNFLKEHTSNVKEDDKTVEELREMYPGEDLTQLLKSRDEDWSKQTYGILKGNLKKHVSRVEDKRDANEPLRLLERAYSALCSVDVDQESFKNSSEVKDLVKSINSIIWDMKKGLDRG